MEVGSFPKRRERVGMNSRNFTDELMCFLKCHPNGKRFEVVLYMVYGIVSSWTSKKPAQAGF